MTDIGYALHELVRLVPESDGTLKVVVTPNECRASFKHPGRHAEVVCEYYSIDVAGVLRELLKRLGWYHRLPTIDNDAAAARPDGAAHRRALGPQARDPEPRKDRRRRARPREPAQLAEPAVVRRDLRRRRRPRPLGRER
jgi:hypothetical protein